MYLYVNEGKIADARFQATGCGVAIACASALTELVIGLSVAACSQIDIAKLVQALDGIPLDKRFCADLAIEALRQALTRLDTGDSMGI
jgi:NifU-like protein involved in Fe-S cluster formation